MGAGRPLPKLELTAEENNRLVEWARRHTTARALALRARIVLGCANGATNSQVAHRLRVTLQTVGNWRQRFVEQRLDGPVDAPRPGQPRKISDAKVEEVLAMTLERRPKEATHWSTRLMAKANGLNQTAVLPISQAFGLQPHRAETSELSADPLFIDKVRDIVGLYLSPPPPRMRWCCAWMRSRRSRRWIASQHARTRDRDPQLSRRPQSGLQALRVEQDGRRDHRVSRPLLSTN